MTYMIGFYLFVKLVLETESYEDLKDVLKNSYESLEGITKRDDKGFISVVHDNGLVYEYSWYKDRERKLCCKNDLGVFKVSFKRDGCFSELFKMYMMVKIASACTELGINQVIRSLQHE